LLATKASLAVQISDATHLALVQAKLATKARWPRRGSSRVGGLTVFGRIEPAEKNSLLNGFQTRARWRGNHLGCSYRKELNMYVLRCSDLPRPFRSKTLSGLVKIADAILVEGVSITIEREPVEVKETKK
jgi:hypothetical protein